MAGTRRSITTRSRGRAALGTGSLFNHRAAPNVGWVRSYADLTITFTTLAAVEAGDELFICYGDARKLWFDDAGGDGGACESSSDDEVWPRGW